MGLRRKDLIAAFKNRELRIGVLMGGFSSERDVSLRSGAAVVKALQSAGHAVEAIDVKSRRAPALSSGRFGCFFIALHGKFGEDGELQSILEKKRIPFTGSGSRSSRLAMDKFATKRAFIRERVPTPPYTFLKRNDRRLPSGFALPVVIKPRAEGSSVGVSIVESASELGPALTEARRYDADVLAERFVRGREVTVGILGARSLPVIELRPKRKFFDFTAKYTDPETEYIVDPAMPAGVKAAAQRLGLKAHRALGCEGFSRVDLIVAGAPAAGGAQISAAARKNRRAGAAWKLSGGASGPAIVVLEVNSIPGMTERSLVPKAARAAGI
ncbi:MAG: D-alanine--D-alanine ligase, partial [Planctomycetota bacterium]|nr:D-alanine--D-alanine ligase [Planctomycetota bacterium]